MKKKLRSLFQRILNCMHPQEKSIQEKYTLIIETLAKNISGNKRNFPLSTEQQKKLNGFLEEPLQDNINKAFLRFIEGDYYINTSSTKKAGISKKLLDCLWQIYQRKDDQDFMININNFCTDSLTDCQSRNHFFIFDLVNFVNIKPKSELNSLLPFQKFEFLKNQALFNYVKKNANYYISKRGYEEYGEFRESVHYTLQFLEAFNGKFGQQLNLQLLHISSERGDYHDKFAVQKFLDSFNPIARAYQSKKYQPIKEIICQQLADDYFEGFRGSYLTELDFIDKENLDKIIEIQKQTRNRETEKLDYEDPNYEQDILRIDRDFKLETKKLLAKHFLRVLNELKPETLTTTLQRPTVNLISNPPPVIPSLLYYSHDNPSNEHGSTQQVTQQNPSCIAIGTDCVEARDYYQKQNQPPQPNSTSSILQTPVIPCSIIYGKTSTQFGNRPNPQGTWADFVIDEPAQRNSQENDKEEEAEKLPMPVLKEDENFGGGIIEGGYTKSTRESKPTAHVTSHGTAGGTSRGNACEISSALGILKLNTYESSIDYYTA